MFELRRYLNTVRPMAFLSVALSGAITAHIAVAGVYKCTDSEGNVYFNDTGCPSDFDREVVEVQRTRPSANNQPSGTDSYNAYNALEDMRQMEYEKDQARLAEQARRSASSARERLEQSERRLAEIEEEMHKLEREARSVRELGGRHASSIRQRWTEEDLAEINQKYTALGRERKDIRALLGYGDTGPTAYEMEQRRMEELEHSEEARRRDERDRLLHEEEQDQLLVDGVPATPVGGGNYIDNTTGHFLQGAAGGVIDTTTGEFLPTH